jgi:hypothetical protein
VNLQVVHLIQDYNLKEAQSSIGTFLEKTVFLILVFEADRLSWLQVGYTPRQAKAVKYGA